MIDLTLPINDGPCTFVGPNGYEYTNQGAYLDESQGMVYITRDKASNRLKVTTWSGEVIANEVTVTSEWRVYGQRLGMYKMRAIKFKVNDTTYHGRYSCDWSELCKVKRVKGR
jgi:hypothetical protein